MASKQMKIIYSVLLFSILIIAIFYLRVGYALFISFGLLLIELGILYILSKPKKEQKENIKPINYVDNLTGLFNREKFFIDLKEAKGIVLIDIDDFSLLNIVYSREFGDEFLRKLSHKLKENSLIDNLYRISGDEFVIISYEEKDLKYLAETILNVINDFYIVKDNILIQVTATIAISYKEPFIETADVALKYGKKNRLNLVIYSKELDLFDENKKFVDITMRLKQALKTKQVIPFFQCITDKDGNIVRYEALMRIKEGEKYLLPAMFLNIAKKTKLYSELTFQMIQKTFDYMKDKNISFSINISYDDIINDRIVDSLLDAISNFHKPQNVIIELLETENVKNFDDIKTFIDKIHQKGAKIAIDDFGSGYSNFIYLEKLNVDIIKIDGEIITQILSSDNAMFLVNTIVEFCKKNNIISIAEYVSHRDIFMALKEIDVDEYQGFYFCKPKESIE